MCWRRTAKLFCRLFGRQISLGFSEHFIADHEFANRRRAQQGWIEMGMQDPVALIAGEIGGAVPAHRIGKWTAKQIVIPSR